MPSRQLPTSLAVARFLKEQRKGLGYTLRQVAELSENEGKLIPLSTLARIEQGKLDPGLPRLQQLLRIYSVPMQIAGDLLDLEDFAGDLPKESDPARLLEIARKASLKQDYRAAISVYLSLTQRGEGMDRVQRQHALLGLAQSASHFGKVQFSKYVLERLLLEPPDPGLMVPVLIQIARCWQWLKGYEAALAFLDRAGSHVTRRAQAPSRARIFHQRASLLSELKQSKEAEAALAVALTEYRRAKDNPGYGEGLRSRAKLEFGQNRFERALAAAQAARVFAQRHKLEKLRLQCMLDEARAELSLGHETACLRQLGAVVADSAGSDDATVLFHLHYYYWRIYDRRGETARAAVELDIAVQHLNALGENTDEAAHVRELIAARPGGKSRPPK